MDHIGDKLLRFGPGGQHPIIKPPTGPWLVVDEVGFNWKEIADAERANPFTRFFRWLRILPKPIDLRDRAKALDIHLNTDDPHHIFLDETAWEPLPNKRKMARAYNARYIASMRLRERRATEWTGEDAARFDSEYDARRSLVIAEMIRSYPSDPHLHCGIEYQPNGVIWKDGERWLRLPSSQN